MKIYKILSIFFLINLLLLHPLLSSPLDNISKDHWVYDSFQLLSEKGLIEGYPDGYFKGDRPVNRYEMAITIARVAAKLEQMEASTPSSPDLSEYISKDDLDIINKLIKEFRNELNSFGGRTEKIENSIETLNLRIKEIERVKVSGAFNCTVVSSGYSPDELNTSSFGNPLFQKDPSFGPVTINDRDRYSGPNGGGKLYQGSAIMSRLDLSVTVKISESLKAGGQFIAYSAFGEKGIIDDWGLMPPYNSIGQPAGLFGFQANMSSIWFDSEGDLDVTGKIGEFNINKVSKNLFYGLRNGISYAGKDVIPMNGIDICGKLYKRFNAELFLARNINNLRPGDTTGIPDQFRYVLATPYNNGSGAVRLGKYGAGDAGQYDNFLHGLWFGYDFIPGKFHLEGAFLKLYEDYTSNPNLGIDKNLTAPPKDMIYYGIKGNYNFGKDKIKLYGEFNQTSFDYNLLDGKNGYMGTFLNIGVKVKMVPVVFYGDVVFVSPNYDPFCYHQHWSRLYQDTGGHHEGWGWEYGLFACNGRRFSYTRPNRTGFNLGMNWKFGRNYNGTLYVDFSYLQQVKPTLMTDDENSFQRYDFLSGIPVSGSMGINIYGNQEQMFMENDPAKGKEYRIEGGGKYGTGKIHTWGYLEYNSINRDFSFRDYDMNISYYLANGGITYDITEKFKIQGYVNYIRCSGVNEKGEDVKWDQIIPGLGIKYDFSENAEFLIDYKFYTYNSEYPYDVYDSVPDTNNNYNANKLMTRLKINF